MHRIVCVLFVVNFVESKRYENFIFSPITKCSCWLNMWNFVVIILIRVFSLFTSISLMITVSRANAQNEPISSDILTHRKCFVVAESSVYSMINKPINENCSGFICWESQLTIDSKARITRMYNDFRNQLAVMGKWNSMMKMNWHWVLESEALKIISSCPNEELHEYKFQRNIEGLDNSLTCEYSVAKFHLKNPSQKDFTDNLAKFLNSNSAHDFDKNQEFRRASVLHFGCALTVSNSSNVESYFVCVYCSKEKSVSYSIRNCSKYTVKNENLSEFPNLCQAPKYIDLYGCEPKKMCDSNPPESWTKRFPGELEQFYVVTEQETWLVINRTIYEGNNLMRTEKHSLTYTKPTSTSWLFNYSSLSEYCCIYDEETMRMLTASSNSLIGKAKRRFKRAEKTTKILKYSQITDLDFNPKCCTFLFVFNLMLSAGLIVLARFTYVHYKSKIPT